MGLYRLVILDEYAIFLRYFFIFFCLSILAYVATDYALYRKKIQVRAYIPMVAITLGTIVIVCMTVQKYKVESDIWNCRERVKCARYFIHAGGEIINEDGVIETYTNSKEAIVNAYDNGNTFIELDFLMTSDEHLVCAHDYSYNDTWAYGYSFTSPPTQKEFLEQKFCGIYTSISLTDLAQYMRINKDLFIVTDVKDDNVKCCEIIKAECPDLLDRFIVEIYHIEEYQPIFGMGFHNIVYALYKSSSDEMELSRLQKVIREVDLVGIVFEDFQADEDPFFFGLLDTKVPCIVFTVNDKKDMERYIQKGAVAIYTDVTEKKRLYID